MINKDTFKTKTFWTGLGTVVTGIGMIVMGDKVTGIQTVILGVLAITGRDAIVKQSTGK